VDLITNAARAYVYSGMWVADCPAGCGGVEQLFEAKYKGGPRVVRRTLFHCSYCHHATSHIDWPAEEAQIWAVLELRPFPYNRNWYPADHPTAVRFGLEHGQSVQDLRDENEAHGVPATPSEVTA
jgi:hypothetical protein